MHIHEGFIIPNLYFLNTVTKGDETGLFIVQPHFGHVCRK
jgi:hypothetical protein